MNSRKLTLSVAATAACVASTLIAAPAFAVASGPPETAAHSASHRLATPTLSVTASADATRTTIVVTGQAGALATVRDASGTSVAGGPLVGGTGTFVLSTPKKAVSYQLTQTDPKTGEVSPVRNFQANGSLEGVDVAAPTIDTITPTAGDRAVVAVTGEPGAVATVRDGDGTVLGVKAIGTTGKASVPMAAPEAGADDEKVVVSQKLDGTVSDASESLFSAPPKVEVARVTPNNAIVTFEGPKGVGSKLTVRDSNGAVVKNTVLPVSGPIALTFPAPPATTTTYTAERDFGDFHSTTTFTVTGGGTALEKPTLRTTAYVGGVLLLVHGTPYATVSTTVDGVELVKTFNKDGVSSREVSAGSTVTATQRVGTDISPTETMSVPAA